MMTLSADFNAQVFDQFEFQVTSLVAQEVAFLPPEAGTPENRLAVLKEFLGIPQETQVELDYLAQKFQSVVAANVESAAKRLCRLWLLHAGERAASLNIADYELAFRVLDFERLSFGHKMGIILAFLPEYLLSEVLADLPESAVEAYHARPRENVYSLESGKARGQVFDAFFADLEFGVPGMSITDISPRHTLESFAKSHPEEFRARLLKLQENAEESP